MVQIEYSHTPYSLLHITYAGQQVVASHLAAAIPIQLRPPGRDPDSPAVVWADESDPGTLHSWTYAQLADRSAHVAEGLRAMGLQPGAAHMPCPLAESLW